MDTTNNGGGLTPAPRLPDAVRLEPTKLHIARHLTTAEWETVGVWLKYVDDARQWWWGDWLAYGERVYGETYAQFADLSGYEAKTLQNWVYVASNVEPSRRREDATWSHHAALASEAPQEQTRWLAAAVENKWSVAEMNRQRKALQAPADEPEMVQCPKCAGAGEIPREAV